MEEDIIFFTFVIEFDICVFIHSPPILINLISFGVFEGTITDLNPRFEFRRALIIFYS